MNGIKALLIIDAQVNMFDEPYPVYRAGDMLQTLIDLYAKAKVAGIPVFFVRHDGGEGAIDEYGSDGWQIHPDLTPQAREPIVDKRVPDAFEGTDLENLLRAQGIRELVIAGMQTDWCINATSRRAAALGFAVTVVADAHSTCDSSSMTAADIIDQYNRAFSEFAVLKLAADLDFS